MKYLKLTPYNRKTIDQIVDCLNYGGVVVLPTDTVYGLHCLAENKKAINKIFKIKNKAENSRLLILVDSIAMASKFCLISNDQKDYLDSIWNKSKNLNKKGVTAILKTKKNSILNIINDSLALRLPNNDFLIKIIKRIGKPITSTSLNLSGQEIIINVKKIKDVFIHTKPDLIVDGGVLKKTASRIVDIRDFKNIKILRK